jgi:hypothetical protein
LHGLWNQPGGREFILSWLSKHGSEPAADAVRDALRSRIDEQDLSLLNRPPAPTKRRVPLGSLAPEHSRDDWYS